MVWVIGGMGNTQSVSYRTSYYEPYYDRWYEGPQLIYGRYGHSCVTTEYRNGTAIVVAGGYGEYDYIINSVEFLYSGDYSFSWKRGTVMVV